MLTGQGERGSAQPVWPGDEDLGKLKGKGICTAWVAWGWGSGQAEGKGDLHSLGGLGGRAGGGGLVYRGMGGGRRREMELRET